MNSSLKVERFIFKLLNDSKKIDANEWIGIGEEENCFPYWSSWLSDYTLREWIKKMDDLDDITFLNLAGSTLITDQGVIWMCQYLQKCKSLEKVSLQSCCNLTENALLAILNHMPEKCVLELNHTNIDFVPPFTDFYHTMILDNNSLGYNRADLKEDKSSVFSLIIWPSRSVNISGIGLLVDKVSRPLKGNYLEYKSKTDIISGGTLANIINYRYTEVPIHVLVPKDPGHILILVSDDKMEAVAHVVDSVVLFLSHEIPKFAAPIFKVTEEELEYEQDFSEQMKMEMPLSKMSKRQQNVSMKQKKSNVVKKGNNDLIQESAFGYRNISITDGTIKNWGSGVWMSSVPLDINHSSLQVGSEFGTTSLKALKLGFCELKSNWMTMDPTSLHIVMYNVKDGKISYFKEGKCVTQNSSGISPVNSISMTFRVSSGQVMNSMGKFFELEVDDKVIWSRPITTSSESKLVPFLVFGERNCSVKISGDWELSGSFSHKTSTVTMEPSQLKPFLTHFTVVCYGPNCEEVYKEVKNIEWDKKLEEYKNVLNELISSIEKKLADRVDVANLLQLSEATRQQERIAEFINTQSKDKRVSIFKMTQCDEKEINDILTSIGANIREQQIVQPFRFSTSAFTQAAKAVLGAELNYIKVETLPDIEALNNFEHIPRLMEKMFAEMSGIYIKKFNILIVNIEWFDRLLNEVAKSTSEKADYKSLGVHRDSKVWTKSTLTNLLEKFSITQCDHQMWINFLMDLGLVIRIPCVRFSIEDEPYFYISPMESDSGKMLHLASIRKSSNSLSHKIMSMIQYTKVCQDLYSLYPQLLSRIISIGHLQLLSPVATVIHVTGGVELKIEAGENNISICAYLPQTMVLGSSDIMLMNILSYLWSVMHLCTDALDALLFEQKIVSLKRHNRSEEPPPNYSVCYSHQWSNEESNINICTLCGNCSSTDGIDCPYNRIRSQKRGYCLCLRKGSSCQDCGICMSCANNHWANHCTSHPRDRLPFEDTKRVLPDTIINVATSPKFTIQTFSPKLPLLVGLKRVGTSEMIDVFGVTSTGENLDPIVTVFEPIINRTFQETSVSMSLSEVKCDVGALNVNLSYRYAVCKFVDYNEDFEILTYHHMKSYAPTEPNMVPVGIFVGHHQITKEKNRFSIEILNPGSQGFITVGLVCAHYQYNRQPGWEQYSVAYHGDDGGIYHSSDQPIRGVDTFFTKGCKVEVSIEYTKREEGPDSRCIVFKKDGQEVTREVITYEGDLYPAIGMHSPYEQVRLLDDLVWKDGPSVNKNTDDSGLMISPRDTVSLSRSSQPVGFVHIFAGKETVKKITMKVNCPPNVLERIVSLNNLSFGEMSENKIDFLVDDGMKIDVLTFVVEFAYTEDVNEYVLSIDVGTATNTLIHTELKFSKNIVRRESRYKNSISLRRISGPQTPPEFPAYLLTITEKARSRYFHLTKDNYALVLNCLSQNFCMKTENFLRPCYTGSAQIGNHISPNSKPAMVVPVDKSKNEIKVSGHPNPISFKKAKITPLSKAGKPLLSLAPSKDGKFKQITVVNKSSLMAPPPSRPSSTDVFFAKQCNTYHGLNICLLNLLSLYDYGPRKVGRSYSVLALPFNPANITDDSQFLWEHSYSDILKCSSILFYPLCAGRSPNYDSKPHLLHVTGINDSTENISESDLFKLIYLNPLLLEAHKTILNNKFMLLKTDHLAPQSESRFSENEREYLISVILEKITNFMLLNNLLTKEEMLSNGNINLNLGQICDKNYRSLTMDGENLSCRLHSTNFLDEVNLEELADEYSGDVDSIATNPLLEYAEYSQSIVLSGRNLARFPEKLLQRFSNLYSLELRNMFKITHFPENIYDVKGLQRLTISRVKLSEIPNISRFPNLKQLSVSHCPVRSIDIQTDFTRLESVKLISLPISRIPPFLCCSPQLTHLEIKLSGLQTLPKELKNLQNLKELKVLGSTLYYNMFTDKVELSQKCDEEFLFEFPEILSCKLSDVEKPIKSVLPSVDAFLNVPRIGCGYSSSEDKLCFGGFPMAVLQLTKLTSLVINYQGIRSIPKEIERLKNLEQLDISFNHLLETIAPEITKIASFKKITVTHCPAINSPPIEVISRGNVATLAYLKYLLAETVTCNRTKLMFVGLGEAGKTSLLYALSSPDNTAKSIIEDQLKQITDGINIGKYCIDLPNNESIRFSTWDFAGQDVYYNTHQFFLSSKAIYIVVWSVRQGIEHGDLDFWLSSISCHAKDAPVFVVGTRCDQVQTDESSFFTLKKRYSQIENFHLVDSLSGTGIEALRKSLVDVTMRLPYMHQDIPSSILDLENKIMRLRNEKDYVTLKEFEEISMAEGILENDVKNVMQILHDFGSIQYFDTERLKRYVVINPQWIVDIMGNVVSVIDQKISDGIFYHKDMCDVWKDFDNSLYSWMLNLTEEFDLTYPHPTLEPKANIVPCLLSENEPKIEWPSFSQSSDWKYFQIYYMFEFLPAGLFNRIQVRLFDFTDTKEIWKYGSYFMKNDHHVLLKRETKLKLSIRVIGVRPVNVLAMVDEVLQSLIQTSFFGVEFQMEIACPECIEDGVAESNIATKYWSEVSMFPSSVVKKAISKKVHYLQCAELHLNSLKSITENTPETPRPEEFLKDLQCKVETVKGLYAISEKIVVMLHSVKDFEEAGQLKADKFETVFKEFNLTCVRFNESCLTKWKMVVQNCCLCLIVVSEHFIKIPEMNDILEYVKSIKKSFQVIVTGNDSNIMAKWIYSLYFNNVYIRMINSPNGIPDAKYAEVATSIRQICVDINCPERELYDCFISYCWSNSRDAVNKGTKFIPGAIICDEVDPRQLCKYLQAHGISCWIDSNNLTHDMGISTQLSYALQNSKMMIAFVSNEYENSANCMMELRFMIGTLKRPVLCVRVGSNDGSNKISEILLLMQRGEDVISLDFTKKTLVDEQVLLEMVKSILDKCKPHNNSERSEMSSPCSFSALNEQVELIFRQFLNQLIIYSNEYCPRLVVIDIENFQDRSSEQAVKVGEFNGRLLFRVICENEGGWHVVDDASVIDEENRDSIIENCSTFLYSMFQVLEYKNPGLRCLQANVVNKNDFISKIAQVAKSSDMNVADSYRHLIQYYMHTDPDLNKCSLKRYRLTSGRESWMCPKDASEHKRCRLIEKDAITQHSNLSPFDDYDKEILKQLKFKASEYENKYRESFSSIVNSTIEEMKSREDSDTGTIPIMPRLMRYNTMMVSEKEMVTNTRETSFVPIRRRSTLTTAHGKTAVSQGSASVSGNTFLKNRKLSSIPRPNIVGSRFCMIQ